MKLDAKTIPIVTDVNLEDLVEDLRLDIYGSTPVSPGMWCIYTDTACMTSHRGHMTDSPV